jgi:hypothetical protein
MTESTVPVPELVWTFHSLDGEVHIGRTCQTTWPCQGHVLKCGVSLEIGESVGIWKYIKEYVELRSTLPELWNHFKPYECFLPRVGDDAGEKTYTFSGPFGDFSFPKICGEKTPCDNHPNDGNYSSVELWKFIHRRPHLRDTEPEMWKHFCEQSEIPG